MIFIPSLRPRSKALSMRRSISARNGFTLVELLTVVAILAVLFSMILPALHRARDAAQSIACTGQLRQIGVVESLYRTDCDGFEFPVTYDDVPGRPGSGKGLVDLLAHYLDNANININRSVWKCPAVPGEEDTTQYQLTYGCNLGVHVKWTYRGTRPDYRSPKRLEELRRPSEQASMCDASLSSGAWTTTAWLTYTDYNTSNPTFTPWAEMYDPSRGNTSVTNISGWSSNTDVIPGSGSSYHVRWRHNGNNFINVLMVDGHVQSFAYSSKELKCRNFATGY